MSKKTPFLLFIILYSSIILGQNYDKYKKLNWRVYHWLSFSDSIDIYSEEWKKMPKKEKDQLMQIPSNELNVVTTEELIEAYIDCAFTRNLFLYPQISTYYEQLSRGFNGINELTNRKDFPEKIISFYAKMDPKKDSKSKAGIKTPHQIQFIEYLFGNPEVINIFKADQLKQIVSELTIKYQIKSELSLANSDYNNVSVIYALAQILNCKELGM